MANEPVLQIGDALPATELALAGGGERVDLRNQRIAGRPILLWFPAQVPDTALLQRLAEVREAAQAMQALALLVVTADLEDRQHANVVVDQGGVLAARFGLTGGGWVAIDPSGRLAGKPDTEAAALDLCRALFDALPVVEATSQAPVLLVPDVFDPDLCVRLIDFWDNSEKSEDRVARSGRGHQHSDSQIKRRTDVIVAEKELFGVLRRRLGSRLVPEVRKAFQVPITNLEAIRIGCYEGHARGYFGRHRDNDTEFTAHRQFAVSLNLNDSYDGGQVQFPEYGRTLYRPPAGGAVVFSCSLLHEVFPVTAGRRFALFTFLFDAAGAERERKLQEKLIAGGYEGVKPRS